MLSESKVIWRRPKKMKTKAQWKLRIKPTTHSSPTLSSPTLSSPGISETPSSSTSYGSFLQTPTSRASKKPARHLSLHQEKLLKKERDKKKLEMEMALAYCKENNCKGWKAISDLNLKYCKDPRTINNHLIKNFAAGDKEKILTSKEEKSLVKYLVNRNRACQGLTQDQVCGVVLNILRVRQKRNRDKHRGIGNWKYVPLSFNATKALATKKISRSFFRRFRAEHPEIKPKNQHKVSLKRGLRCTREMAIEYLDALAAVLIDAGIAPDLIQICPGIWQGAIDLSRIWAHDETPQFINFNASGQSKKKIFAGTGHDCSRLLKENRESVTVQPFSSFAGELALVQVVFAGAGMTSHMCPKEAVEKIPNLLVSVEEKGCSTGATILEAYKELSKVIDTKREGESDNVQVHVIISDGHKSRFDPKVMQLCEDNGLEQFILWPDTSGATQKHDQINDQLHAKYEEKKNEMYSEYADLNKECFMNILANVIVDWASPEKLVKAGRRVGIASTGLNVDWMNQELFDRAAAIMNPDQSSISTRELAVISPKGVRRNSAQYWKDKYMQLQEREEARKSLEYDLEQVDGLLPYKTVTPTGTNKKKITDVHGSLKATEVRKLVEQREEADRQKEERKLEKEKMKDKEKSMFLRCQKMCICVTDKCQAAYLKQCSICKQVLKSRCTKKACRLEGAAMISVAGHKERKKHNDSWSSSGDNDDDDDNNDDDNDDNEGSGEDETGDGTGEDIHDGTEDVIHFTKQGKL